MDFVVGLPRTSKGYDSIWVIVDRLIKSAHFIPVNTIYTAKKYVEIYFERIVTLHEVPLTIISDRGLVFLSFLGATTAMSRYSSPQKLIISSTN